MIYHKVELESLNKTVNIPLYSDELYCRCPECGIEQEVDDEMMKSIYLDGGDLGSTIFICPTCTKKHF